MKLQVPKPAYGGFNNPGIFQENVSEIFKFFDMVYAYINDRLLITKNDLHEHLNDLEKVLQRLAEAVLNVKS